MLGKRNRLILGLLGALLVSSSFGAGAGTAEIERVRKKHVLSSTDFEVIDAFLADAIERLLTTDEEDFASIADIRRAVIVNKSSATQSAREQYAGQFFKSAATHLADAFSQLQDVSDQELKNKIMLNLMILLDNLEDLRLAKLAMKMVTAENAPVRYWAVHAVTNPKIVEQLNSANAANPGGAVNLADEIVQVLRAGMYDEDRYEILALTARFAGSLKTAQAQKLLLELADMRIKKYADWSVDGELLELDLLRLLSDRIASRNRNDPAAARRFAQLYSYAIQRYLKSMTDADLLRPEQKQQLISVLVETEQRCLAKLTGVSQSTIKTTIEKSKATALSVEHDSLLGGPGSAGRLLEALNFDYGTNADGSRRTSPLILPDPPKPRAAE